MEGIEEPKDNDNEWWMNECVFIYRTYHIVSQGGLQFYLSEIGRQVVNVERWVEVDSDPLMAPRASNKDGAPTIAGMDNAELPYLLAYKPISAISRDPKLFCLSSC